MHSLRCCLVLAIWMPTLAAADGLSDCAAIASRDARLDCYDTLAHRAPDKTPAAPLSAAPPPAARALAPAVKNDDPNLFGLTPEQRGESYVGPARISAHITEMSSAPPNQSTVVLDNGQVWRVTGEDGAYSLGDKVTIKRAAMGTFLMIAPSNHFYRVKRLR